METDVPALSEPVYRILLALSGEARHGYAILQALEADGFIIGTGTLYSALKRLRADGVVQTAPAPEGADPDPRRRYYSLTVLGHQWVTTEARRLEALVSLSRRHAIEPGPA